MTDITSESQCLSSLTDDNLITSQQHLIGSEKLSYNINNVSLQENASAESMNGNCESEFPSEQGGMDELINCTVEDVSYSGEKRDDSSNSFDLSNVGAETVDITPDNDGGVMKQLWKEGSGDKMPIYGCTVSVRYRLFVAINKSLEPISSEEQISSITLGKGTVVRGLELAFSSMKKNEVAFFIIQPNYAYGSMGLPPLIPPYTVLFSEVELLHWKYEDLSPRKDDGIMRKVLQKGEGSRFPNEGSTVKVGITGFYQGEVFEDREVEFILGEGCSVDIPEGVEVALFKFKKHEESLLYLKPQYAFESKGKKEFGIPPDASVEYKVALYSFEKAKEVWEMNSDEKYEKAREAKVNGIPYFKDGNYKVALRQFKKIITFLENEPGVPPESQKPRQELLISGYQNAALCLKKLENYIDAINIYDKVLALDPVNEKALYQRGQCRMLINDCVESLQDLQKLSFLKPQSKLYMKAIEISEAKLKKQRKKEKALYKNMFQKFVQQDAKGERPLKTETGVWEGTEDDEEESIVKMLSSADLD